MAERRAALEHVLGALRRLEGVALMLYICLAMLGVAFGVQFCQNVAYMNGNIGDLISSGTIAWMDEAVAFNVLTGSIVLTIGMLSILYPLDVDLPKGGNDDDIL